MLVHRDQSDCDHAEQSDHARAEVDGETEPVRRARGAQPKNPGDVGCPRDCHAGTVLNFAGLSEKVGMISCAKRRRLSREPPQLIITYSTPARRKASSLPMISSGVPTRLFASASSGT